MDKDPDPQARKFWRFIAILFAVSALLYFVAWLTASGQSSFFAAATGLGVVTR